MSIIPNEANITPTEQPQAAKPKAKSANGPRRHKLTGSSVSLQKRSDGWYAVCESHGTSSAAQTTRNLAEAERVRSTFCKRCSALLVNPPAKTAKSTPAKGAQQPEAPEASQPTPKTKRQRKGE